MAANELPSGETTVGGVKLIDLPEFDTSVDRVIDRLKSFLKDLRVRRRPVAAPGAPVGSKEALRFLARHGPFPLERYRAPFEDVHDDERGAWEQDRRLRRYRKFRDREEEYHPESSVDVYRGPPRPRADRVKNEASLSSRDIGKIVRRATELVRRREAASGLAHLRDSERSLVTRVLGEVPVVRVGMEHRADEIAGALHEEMPWMAPATKAVWHALRLNGAKGEPVKVGPLLVVGRPGTGKTSWALRLAELVTMPSCLIDASQGLSSFSLAGTERGWASAQPGRPLATIINSRIANPLMIIDEICKSGSLRSTSGLSVAFLPALLGLLERKTASGWMCPYFRVAVDMSHLSWIMTANTVATLPEPLLSRCRIVEIEDPTSEQLEALARRQGAAMGLSAVATEAVIATIAKAARKGRPYGGLRSVIRMLERAEEIDARPSATLH